jgi:hypothetical protein
LCVWVCVSTGGSGAEAPDPAGHLGPT